MQCDFAFTHKDIFYSIANTELFIYIIQTHLSLVL